MGEDRDGLAFINNPYAIVPNKEDADHIVELHQQESQALSLLKEFVKTQPDDYGSIAALNTRVATFLGRPTVPDKEPVELHLSDTIGSES